jgi:hypothetical protein
MFFGRFRLPKKTCDRKSGKYLRCRVGFELFVSFIRRTRTGIRLSCETRSFSASLLIARGFSCEQVARIIEMRQQEWGWSRVDVARAMSHVLPQTKSERTVRMPAPMDGPSMVWDDIPSIAAALLAQAAGEGSVVEEQAATPDPVVAALLATDGASAGRAAAGQRFSFPFCR